MQIFWTYNQIASKIKEIKINLIKTKKKSKQVILIL